MGLDSYTKLLIHFNGTDGQQTYTTEDSVARTVTFAGTAQLDTAQKKFGSASLLLDGNSDYVTIPDHADWNFAANDFTVETVGRFVSVAGSQMIVANYDTNGDRGWAFFQNGGTTLQFTYSTDGSSGITKSVSVTINIDTWYHLAVVRNGNDLKFFLDGVQQGATQDVTGVTIFNAVSSPLSIGCYFVSDAPDSFMNGWIDETRISNIARWTANFTPSTGEYGNGGAKCIIL